MGNISQRLPQNYQDSRSGSHIEWIHIVEWIAPFVKKIAGWSVLKARTEAVRRVEKIQFDGFYLTRGHYSNGATFHDAKTGKIIYYVLCARMEVALAAWPTMLRHQAAENSDITSGVAKKVLFSSRDNCNCWVLKQLERASYFKHGFFDKMENKKDRFKRVVKEAHFPF